MIFNTVPLEKVIQQMHLAKTAGKTMDYKSINVSDLDTADRATICRLYRFLPSPETPEQEDILSKVAERFRHLGGFTPGISKLIGWEE